MQATTTIRSMVASVFIAGITAAGSASATPVDFDFSYTGPGVSVSGVLITDGVLTDSYYNVTDITGTRNGVAISGLVNPGGTADRIYLPGDPNDDALGYLLDNVGIYFKVGRVTYQVFEGIGGPQGLPTGVVEDLHNTNREIDVSFTATPVPEPWSAALFGTGLIGVAVLRARPARRGGTTRG